MTNMFPADPADQPEGAATNGASSTPVAPSEPAAAEAASTVSSNKALWVTLVVIAVAVVGAVAFILGTGQGGNDTPATPTAAVPNVVGFTEADATNTLVAAGFRVTVVTESQVKDAEPGTVFRQDPAAGVEAAEGSEIILSVAALTVTVPDVKGLTETEATNLLLGAGLKVGKTTTQSSKDPAGTVLSQDPLPGEKLERDETVNLVLSDGKQEIPNVIGLQEAKARAQVSSAGFTVEVVTRVTEDPKQAGVVLQMNPPAKRQAQVGSTVVLTIGDYRPAPTPTPTPTPAPTTEQAPAE